MPRINNKKRPTSSKKKKKKSKNGSGTTSATAQHHQQPQQPQTQPPMDLDQILSQADAAYETSNAEHALQLYTYAQMILQKQIENFQQQQQQQQQEEQVKKDDCVSKIMTCAKVSCKIAEIKVSFHDPSDNGYNDFMNGIQLLSQENEQKYINTDNNNDQLMIAQWKEARANLFLYLGQLSCEKDALASFTNAIHDLKGCLSLLEQMQTIASSASPTSMVTSSNDDEQRNVKAMIFETRKQMCGAYCSVAELYLTDLCFEENAEKECEQSLNLALELDKLLGQELKEDGANRIVYTPDAVQAMANLRLCQNRPMEAIPYIIDAYSRMKVGCEALSELVGLGVDTKGKQATSREIDMKEEEATELKGEALEAANSLPGFEFRCQTSKILLECAANLEGSKTSDSGNLSTVEKIEEQRLYCVEAAIQILGSLLAENDEVIETFYLLGCAFQTKSTSDHEASKFYFENALQMLEKTKDQIQGDDMMNEGSMMNPLEDVIEKIEDVKKKINEVDQLSSSKMDED